ncbi:MAG TPA: Maf family protein [Bryobacteraceae bacterium]|nr:Maf family protein [Bryobacteraceae bacterium]
MLVLASQSPRRRDILRCAGLSPTVRVSGVAEQRLSGEGPRHYVRRLARSKAEAVQRSDGEVVLGADTIVVLDNLILEKPADADDARRMLSLLSGREHQVITGICLLHDEGVIEDAAETSVSFARLSQGEIADYVDSGEPMDKAGAYGIQGRASRFIHRVEGCYFNVVGLPIAMVYKHLKRIGFCHIAG